MESNVIFVSEEYKKLNAKLHRRPLRGMKSFGADGRKWVNMLLPILHQFKVRSLLDYGCGKETLWKTLRNSYGEWGQLPTYVGYDPCVKGKEELPKGQYDMVVCTDVLEHVEPEYLNNVLAHICVLTGKVVFFNIALLPAITLLPDGSNAHQIVESSDWWGQKLLGFFPYGLWRWKEIENDRPYKRLHLMMERIVCTQ